MTNIIRKRKFTIWLAFATFFLGWVVALLIFNGTGTKIKLVIAQEEPAKENTTYALVTEQFWNRSGRVHGAKDIWEIYGVKDFELNDDYIVERFWYSPIVDEVMDRWMHRGTRKLHTAIDCLPKMLNVRSSTSRDVIWLSRRINRIAGRRETDGGV